jgi:oxygen-independent coproporphyrinogen-3 oxidase
MKLDPDLILRLDRPGPRYTSYPPADRFRPDFGEADALAALTRCDSAPEAPLSVYVHLPHCARLCGYCACNVLPTKSLERRADYIDLLISEVALVTARLPRRRSLGQLHFGGGTPNSYRIEDLARLASAITAHFVPTDSAELAIEIDPRYASLPQVEALRALGFNRISFGVQDFDPAVQKAIGRHQSRAETLAAVDSARLAGFGSINIDLVYGLPLQTLDGFERTLDALIDAAPDRVALFSFAYLPAQRKNQRGIDATTLPPAPDKVKMLVRARERLADAGYVGIGMDHFARPGDALADALRSGRLRRNFQGYTVAPIPSAGPTEAGDEAPLEVLGLGLSAVGDLGGAYTQNTKDLETYVTAILAGRLPIERGLTLTADDVKRRLIIERLMTRFRLEPDELARHGLTLERDFADALGRLAPLELDGLVTTGPQALALTPLGELFPRLVAMCFDAKDVGADSRYSRVV